ncbi:MAG: hypothetical protein AAF431_13065 [Pseudomonadota bacterium]
MKHIVIAFIVFFVSQSAFAQFKNTAVPSIDIDELVGAYATRSGERVLLDPRVKGRVQLLGQSITELSYENLATILRLHQFGTYRSDGYLIVIPVNIMKQRVTDLVTEGEEYAENQYVNDLITVEKVCLNALMPVLRPLVPPTAHFAPVANPRSILMTGTYANTKRIREIIQRLDAKLDKKQSCKPWGEEHTGG